MSGLAGRPFLAPYSLSKGALATLTRNAGFALMRHRIHVNQLDIGWMNSDHERALILSEAGGPGFIHRAAAGKPFGRILDPKEVARAVPWMSSDDSGMLEGRVQTIKRGADDVSDDAKVRTRTPPGRSEGYLEAFANLYAGFAEALRARRDHREPGPIGRNAPLAYDGLKGVAILEAVVDSHEAADQPWLKPKAVQASNDGLRAF